VSSSQLCIVESTSSSSSSFLTMSTILVNLTLIHRAEHPALEACISPAKGSWSSGTVYINMYIKLECYNNYN
jgi:hypothetical protein